MSCPCLMLSNKGLVPRLTHRSCVHQCDPSHNTRSTVLLKLCTVLAILQLALTLRTVNQKAEQMNMIM